MKSLLFLPLESFHPLVKRRRFSCVLSCSASGPAEKFTPTMNRHRRLEHIKTEVAGRVVNFMDGHIDKKSLHHFSFCGKKRKKTQPLRKLPLETHCGWRASIMWACAPSEKKGSTMMNIRTVGGYEGSLMSIIKGPQTSVAWVLPQ